MSKRHRTLAEAYAENAAECARTGHSWIAYVPNGTMRYCSWCGISEIIWLARQERIAAEQARARTR